MNSIFYIQISRLNDTWLIGLSMTEYLHKHQSMYLNVGNSYILQVFINL